VAVDLHALAGIGQLGAVDLENGHVAIEETAGLEVLAVGAETDRFGQAADLHLADFCHLPLILRTARLPFL
jgi:hypothetical protein